jgi:hypothetical protein
MKSGIYSYKGASGLLRSMGSNSVRTQSAIFFHLRQVGINSARMAVSKIGKIRRGLDTDVEEASCARLAQPLLYNLHVLGKNL